MTVLTLQHAVRTLAGRELLPAGIALTDAVVGEVVATGRGKAPEGNRYGVILDDDPVGSTPGR